MIGTILTNLVKPAVSCVMSLTMAMTSVLTGPAGEYAKLQAKAMMENPAKSETKINLMLDLAAIEAAVGGDFELEQLPEIENIYSDGKVDISATFYTYGDTENTKFALSFTENLSDGYAIYFDEDGMAVTPALVDTALQVLSVFDTELADTYAVYTKYFANNGIYVSWDDMLDVDEEDYTPEVDAIVTVIKDVIEIVGSEENAKALADAYTPVLKSVEKYYTETEVDGVKAYTAKMNGMQYVEYSTELYDIIYSEETINGLLDYVIGLADDIDYIKYVNMFKTLYPDDVTFTLPEGITNQQIAMLVAQNIELYREDVVKSYTDVAQLYTDSGIFEYIITGKDEAGYFEKEENAELKMIVDTLRPFLANSYTESVIYEKSGVITESIKLAVADGKALYGELEIINSTSKYDGVLPNTEDVVPFDLRVEYEEIDNKLGYEDALELGVNSIEINWVSMMRPEDNELEIENPHFFVNYKSSMIEDLKNDPAFLQMSAEVQEMILGMYEDSDYEYKSCDTTAHLIDNSVYLPLRQLMENAGYEVSWDGEARKAYVTVDGTKIEMTGTIINDRTYVKVRDFEKLGATVEYEESFFSQNAYNDFTKWCTATITFSK